MRDSMSIMTIGEALHHALHDEMARDPSVFTIGEEVGFNGLYGVTKGLGNGGRSRHEGHASCGGAYVY